MFGCQDICIFNYPMIYQIFDEMISISTWDRVHFWYIFWTTTHKVNKPAQLIDISKGNNFQESFEQFGGLELSFSSLSNKQPAPIT